MIVEDIQGLSSLLVGMPECATHSRLFSPKPEGKHGELHWLYVLDGREVVFGCRDGVTDALRQMDRAGAKAILLIATCVPELIGEDIEGIIHEIQPEISARVTFVMLGQFKNTSYPPGSWKTMEALERLMLRTARNPRRINVLGRAPDEDHIPLPSLLPALTNQGFDLRCLAPGASLENFQNAADAALNLVVSPYTMPLAVKMEQDFGIPFVALHHLYDVEAIDNAYAVIAAQFGFSWDGSFDEERQEALALQEQVKKNFQGFRYVFSVRIDLPLPLAVYLGGLGMEPLLLHLEDYYPEDGSHAKKLAALGFDPLICRIVNAEADVAILEKLAPDLVFGYVPEQRWRKPCVPDIFDFYGQVGYKRTSAILRRMVAAMDSTKSSENGRRGHGSASI